MKTYQEMVRDYKKRQHDTMVDALSTGLTYADEICVETGLLEETGLLSDLTEGISGALPFVIIAATEGSKVVLGRKPGATALKDTGSRMLKTGAALGVGAAVAAAGGGLAAVIPATMGVRALFDRYRSKALTGHRVQGRIQRLKELERSLAPQEAPASEPAAEPLPEGIQTILPANS